MGVNRTSRRAMKQSIKAIVTASRRFAHVGDGLVGHPPEPTQGNTVEAGFDGPQVYSRMIATISEARHSVWLSQYILSLIHISEPTRPY